MPDVTVAPRSVLEAQTDQALAHYAGHAARMTDRGRAFFGLTAADLARDLTEEFPGVPLARVVAAFTASLQTVAKDMGATDDPAEDGKPGLVTVPVLLTIAAMTAVELARTEAGHE